MTQNKKKFIEDYTALIARLNGDNQSLLWWATDISSKNRYTGLLADYMQELTATGSMPKTCRLSAFVQRYKRVGGIIWLALCIFFRSILVRRVLGQKIKKALADHASFYVIKTFSYDSSFDEKGQYHDAFFGRLPQELRRNKENVLLFIYVIGNFRLFLSRAKICQDLLVPVEFFLQWKDIVRAVKDVLKFRVQLKRPLLFGGEDVRSVIKYELYRTFNGIQIQQLLHYHCTRGLLKTCQAHNFLMTYENNPWERMCILACRDHSPSTKVIGYQHSVVPEAALNMFIHSSEKNIVPLPHLILTTGEIPKDILRYYGDYSLVPVMSACALRYEYLFHIKPTPRGKSQGRILLVLDGVNQTRLMLKFVLEQLGGHSHYRLRIRCHPALPWGLLASKFHFDKAKYANVEISKDALQEDLAWSDMIIYWQTAVVLEAMSRGKPAINFRTNDILSYDPLFQSDALKWTVLQQDNLLETIATIEAMDGPFYQKQLSGALDYIKKYFYQESPSALEIFRFDSQELVH